MSHILNKQRKQPTLVSEDEAIYWNNQVTEKSILPRRDSIKDPEMPAVCGEEILYGFPGEGNPCWELEGGRVIEQVSHHVRLVRKL